MKTRPKSLTFLSLFLFAVAIGIPAQIMVLYEHPIWEMGAIAGKISPLNWAILMMAPIVGVLTYRASPSSRYLVPIFGMLVVYNNWFVAEVGVDFSQSTVKMSTAAFLACLSTMLSREAREILTHPERRWWLTPKRREVALPIRICFFQKKGQEAFGTSEVFSRTFDVSNGGTFVSLEDENMRLLPEATLQKLQIGTQCYVSITLKDLVYLQCRAEIVRKTHARGHYPAGVGIRFLGMNWNDQRMLNEYLKKIKVPKAQRLVPAVAHSKAA